MAESGTKIETEEVQQQEDQEPQQQLAVEDEDDRKLFVGGLPQDATQVKKTEIGVDCLISSLITVNSS